MKRLSWVLFTMGFSIAVDGYAQTMAPAAQNRLKDPIELCDRLAGTEREICVRQARETPGGAARGATGAAPGTPVKSDDDKRGNTPPGVSRSGDAPASGAIVDPAGVTKR